MTVELNNLQSHPLAQKFYDLGVELEKLPGDPRQTDLITKLSELKIATQTLINDPIYGMPGAVKDTLWCLFSKGPTWDGDLPSKSGRSELVEGGYAERHEGWNWLTSAGVNLALRLGLGQRKECRSISTMKGD